MRKDESAALILQGLVEVRADGELVLDRNDRAREADDDAIAEVRERGPLDGRERTARGEELRFDVVARLERELGLAQDRQTRGIRFGRRRIISTPEKRAAHAERPRTGIAEVELQSRQRLDIRVLRRERCRERA